jgi:DNA mismatch endonuclease (patch repair protein)
MNKNIKLKGHTYEEFYGKEMAEILRKNRGDYKRGKTWEEIYGIKEATKMKEKRKIQKNIFGQCTTEWRKLSMEEKYGKEKADKIKQKLSNYWRGRGHPQKEETKEKISKYLLGKTFEQKFGKEKAAVIIQKIKDKNKNKPIYHPTEEIKQKIREARLKQKMPLKHTSIEIAVQNELYNRNIKFNTQLPLLKICIADIFIAPNIVIFCDGDYWHNYPDGLERDHAQNKALSDAGYIVLRFWERDIKKNIREIINQIEDVIKNKSEVIIQ